MNRSLNKTLSKIVLGFILIVFLAAFLIYAKNNSIKSAVTTEQNLTANDRTQSVKHAIKGGRAKNIILLIGDGMGDSEITIARNYGKGAAGRLTLDQLSFTGAYTTYSVQEDDPSLPDYVPDSAATATAWATGFKTSNGRISTAPNTDEDLTTILELVQEIGFRTGSVSTMDITDATPAALASHVSDRSCRGPQNMGSCPQDRKLNGGPGSIAEQEVANGVDVLLGGGRSRFEQVIDDGLFIGMTVIESAIEQDYTVITDTSGLQTLQPGDGKVLGLFAPVDMSLEFGGEFAMPFPGSGPQICSESQRPLNQPSLEFMTKRAIELLDESQAANGNGKANGRPGFFLQVEGALIDSQDHTANPCGQIGETLAFDRAVHVALEFAENNPDTLVIVSADHAHTSQIIPNPTETDHSPGAYSTLITADGVEMTVNYATNLFGRPQSHTGSQVRIAAQGPQAANVVGVTDNTDLFHTMARAIGVE
ncbi:MAG: alkaline phosphatase [Thermodesulfobacteriota bacterium]